MPVRSPERPTGRLGVMSRRAYRSDRALRALSEALVAREHYFLADRSPSRQSYLPGSELSPSAGFRQAPGRSGACGLRGRLRVVSGHPGLRSDPFRGRRPDVCRPLLGVFPARSTALPRLDQGSWAARSDRRPVPRRRPARVSAPAVLDLGAALACRSERAGRLSGVDPGGDRDPRLGLRTLHRTVPRGRWTRGCARRRVAVPQSAGTGPRLRRCRQRQWRVLPGHGGRPRRGVLAGLGLPADDDRARLDADLPARRRRASERCPRSRECRCTGGGSACWWPGFIPGVGSSYW